ncbi:MAG: hypothetical protein ABIJ27_00045 [Candidatus Omnitrophota bacterium]
MGEFSKLFGVERNTIRKTCLVTPVLSKVMMKALHVERMYPGAVYSTGDNGSFSVVATRIGAPFVGDAVLYLEDTPCRDLVFFGSCGAAKASKKLALGALCIVKKALSQDSFVDILIQRKPSGRFYPDADFYERIVSEDGLSVPVTCLTVGSLKLEVSYAASLKKERIDILDMETAAFYAAANHSSRRAIALLFVTDILKKIPYYEALTKENRPRTLAIAEKAALEVYRLVHSIAK